MSLFEQTFQRLSALYDTIEDFGPGVLHFITYELLCQDKADLATAVAITAANIYAPDDTFIVEGETTNNQVFVEVFRRIVQTSFKDHEDDPEAMLQKRQMVLWVANYLTQYAANLKAQGL